MQNRFLNLFWITEEDDSEDQIIKPKKETTPIPALASGKSVKPDKTPKKPDTISLKTNEADIRSYLMSEISRNNTPEFTHFIKQLEALSRVISDEKALFQSALVSTQQTFSDLNTADIVSVVSLRNKSLESAQSLYLKKLTSESVSNKQSKESELKDIQKEIEILQTKLSKLGMNKKTIENKIAEITQVEIRATGQINKISDDMKKIISTRLELLKKYLSTSDKA